VLVSGTVIYQGVRHDTTLTGSGITGDELKVDTAKLATRYYVGTTTAGGVTPSTISPSTITSDQDNYNPTAIGKSAYVRISGDNGIRAITGIADSVAGTLEKTLINVGSYPIYFPMDHPDSDAAHRFTGNSGDFVLYPGQSCKIWYDLTITKWRVIGSQEYTKPTVFYSFSSASATAGDLQDLAILATSSGTNTVTAATTTMPASNLIATTTANGSGYIMYFADGPIQVSAFQSAHLFAEATISVPVLSDATDRFTFELQFCPVATTSTIEQNNTVAIRYQDNINSGEFELFNQDNSAGESLADSGIPVVAATLYKIRLEIDKSKSESRMYINGAFAGRATGTLPNSVAISPRLIIQKTSGTTNARGVAIHNFQAGAIYP